MESNDLEAGCNELLCVTVEGSPSASSSSSSLLSISPSPWRKRRRGGRSTDDQGPAPKIFKKRKPKQQRCSNLSPPDINNQQLAAADFHIAGADHNLQPAANSNLYGHKQQIIPAYTAPSQSSTIFRKFSADKANFKEIVHQFTGINATVQLQSCCSSSPQADHVPSCRCNYHAALDLMPRRDALLANAVSQSLRTLQTISACLLLSAGSPQQSSTSASPGLLRSDRQADIEMRSSSHQELSTPLQAVLVNLPQGLAEMANTSQQLMSSSTVFPIHGRMTASTGQERIPSVSSAMPMTDLDLTPVTSCNKDHNVFLVSLASLLLNHVASQSQLLKSHDYY